MSDRESQVKLTKSEMVSLESRGYTVVKKINEGAFAKVYCFAYKQNKKEQPVASSLLACKVMDITLTPTEFVKKFLPRELDALIKLKHPYLVHTHSIFLRRNKYFIFMRYMENGDLLDYILRKGVVSEDLARLWLRQLSLAVQYMHILELAHRDIKCENVLLTANKNAKLSDFGFCRECVSRDGKILQSTTFCGSLSYTAPEIVSGKHYYPKPTDIWSLGIVLYVMLNRDLPFNQTVIKTLHKAQMAQNWKWKKPHTASDPCKRVLREMLDPHIETRIKIDELVNCTWFKLDGRFKHMLPREISAYNNACKSVGRKQIVHPTPTVDRLLNTSSHTDILFNKKEILTEPKSTKVSAHIDENPLKLDKVCEASTSKPTPTQIAVGKDEKNKERISDPLPELEEHILNPGIMIHENKSESVVTEKHVIVTSPAHTNLGTQVNILCSEAQTSPVNGSISSKNVKTSLVVKLNAPPKMNIHEENTVNACVQTDTDYNFKDHSRSNFIYDTKKNSTFTPVISNINKNHKNVTHQTIKEQITVHSIKPFKSTKSIELNKKESLCGLSLYGTEGNINISPFKISTKTKEIEKQLESGTSTKEEAQTSPVNESISSKNVKTSLVVKLNAPPKMNIHEVNTVNAFVQTDTDYNFKDHSKSNFILKTDTKKNSTFTPVKSNINKNHKKVQITVHSIKQFKSTKSIELNGTEGNINISPFKNSTKTKEIEKKLESGSSTKEDIEARYSTITSKLLISTGNKNGNVTSEQLTKVNKNDSKLHAKGSRKSNQKNKM